MQERSNSAKWKMAIKFKYIAHATPQQNYLSEITFVSICKCDMAMMHTANLPQDIKLGLYTKAFEMATLLDGLAEIDLAGIKATQCKDFLGKDP